MNIKRLPAEYEPQDAVMLTWPDEMTPWDELESVQQLYIKLIYQIQRFEKLVLVTSDIVKTKQTITHLIDKFRLESIRLDDILYVETDINDTWARDHGPIAVVDSDGNKFIYDFVFNGWGQKFASNYDNYITYNLVSNRIFQDDVDYCDLRPFVLEGGSIETDGKGTLLTTYECLSSKNRNEYLSIAEIENKLKDLFGLKRVIFLNNGSISGDDTDSHVDILARFCDSHTIAYSSCNNEDDENYHSLKELEKELKELRTLDGKPYNLIELPIPPARYLDGYRLPATYANFLILNGAVILPGAEEKYDNYAKKQLEKAFPDREVIVIDGLALLSGHGSIHCISMQIPEGFIRTK